MGGQILLANTCNPLLGHIESLMTVMGAQGALGSAWVIQLTFGVSIIDENDRPSLHAAGKACQPRSGPGAPLQTIAGGPRKIAAAGGGLPNKYGLDNLWGCRPLTPDKLITFKANAPFHNISVSSPLEPLHGHGIEHLVGDHKPRKPFLCPAQPLNRPEALGGPPLLLGKVSRKLHHLHLQPRHRLFLCTGHKTGSQVAAASAKFANPEHRFGS